MNFKKEYQKTFFASINTDLDKWKDVPYYNNGDRYVSPLYNDKHFVQITHSFYSAIYITDCQLYDRKTISIYTIFSIPFNFKVWRHAKKIKTYFKNEKNKKERNLLQKLQNNFKREFRKEKLKKLKSIAK